jgi:hypothetical protein
MKFLPKSARTTKRQLGSSRSWASLRALPESTNMRNFSSMGSDECRLTQRSTDADLESVLLTLSPNDEGVEWSHQDRRRSIGTGSAFKLKAVQMSNSRRV